MFQGSGGIFQDPDNQTWPVLEVSNILFTPLNNGFISRFACLLPCRHHTAMEHCCIP